MPSFSAGRGSAGTHLYSGGCWYVCTLLRTLRLLGQRRSFF